MHVASAIIWPTAAVHWTPLAVSTVQLSPICAEPGVHDYTEASPRTQRSRHSSHLPIHGQATRPIRHLAPSVLLFICRPSLIACSLEKSQACSAALFAPNAKRSRDGAQKQKKRETTPHQGYPFLKLPNRADSARILGLQGSAALRPRAIYLSLLGTLSCGADCLPTARAHWCFEISEGREALEQAGAAGSVV